MGGKVKDGHSIISGLVKNEIKYYIDTQVNDGAFRSRCQAIGYIITKYVKKRT